MNANDMSRDPRLSKNDPRLVRHNQNVEEKKRTASQAPTGAVQPNQKNPKASGISNGPSANDPRRRPSVDSPTASSSRRGSIQSNGVNAANTASHSGTANGTQPHGLASEHAPTANGAVANMSNGEYQKSPNPLFPSVLRRLPSEPSLYDLLQASAEVGGTLWYHRTERDKAGPPLQKALREYKNLTHHFENFPAIKEMHETAVRIAKKKSNNANELVLFFERESAEMKRLIASKSATSSTSDAFVGTSTANLVPTQSRADPETNKQLDDIRQKLEGVQHQMNDKLDAVQQQVNALRQNYNSLKEDISLLREGLSSHKSDTASLESDVSKFKTNVKTLTADLKDLKLDIKENEKNAEAKMDEKMDKMKRVAITEVGREQEVLEAQVTNLEDQSRRLDEGFESIKGEVAAVRKIVTEQGHGGDINRQHDNLRNALDELAAKLSKVETEAQTKAANPNPLGLVQFAPVVGPEDQPDDPELPQMQQMWSAIESLRMATDNNKKQLDNLTTDDVVHQMVHVMGQHWPDAKNCQAAVESLKAGIVNINQRIDQVAARQGQDYNGQAKGELDQLRGELDQLKIKVDGQDLFLGQGKEQFDEMIDRVTGIANKVANLEGQQKETQKAVEKAIG